MAERESSVLLNEDLEKSYRKQLKYHPQKILLSINFLILFSNFAFLLLNSSSWVNAAIQRQAKLSVYSPAIDSITEKAIQFDGSFISHSVFKGEPTPELDEAWERIAPIKYFPLSQDEVYRLGKDPAITVKFPPENQFQEAPYAGLLEVFHQLHCLKTVRQYIYLANYTHRFPFSEKDNLLHIDHCIDMLRQFIMCNADVGVVTLNWVTFMDHPTSDFSTNHVCRDFDQILQWSNEKGLESEGALFHKTNDIIQLDHYP